MRVVVVFLSTTPGDLRMVRPSVLPVGGGLRSRLVRVVPVFVRCTRPADPRCVGMFARHQRSCWYPWLVVFCFIFPCRPCSARFRSRSSGLVSAISTFGSIPGPFGLRFAGGTGGNLDIWLSMFIQLTRCSVRSCTRREHCGVRQYAFSSRLSRYSEAALTQSCPLCSLIPRVLRSVWR